MSPNLEALVMRYLSNKDIAKERTEENKLLLEQIKDTFEDLNEKEIVISLPSGEYAVITLSVRQREVLDRDLLADELRVPKDELKTPFDFSAFTAKGLLSPAMITKHTSIEREMKVKVVKRKAIARRRRKK